MALEVVVLKLYSLLGHLQRAGSGVVAARTVADVSCRAVEAVLVHHLGPRCGERVEEESVVRREVLGVAGELWVEPNEQVGPQREQILAHHLVLPVPGLPNLVLFPPLGQERLKVPAFKVFENKVVKNCTVSGSCCPGGSGYLRRIGGDGTIRAGLLVRQNRRGVRPRPGVPRPIGVHLAKRVAAAQRHELPEG